MAVTDILAAPVANELSLPRLAPGTELLGQYQDSAYVDPRYLVRRADGQVMQLPQLLYRILGSLDGRSAGQVASALSAEFNRELNAEQITYLVQDRLRPAGVLAADDVAADMDTPGDDVDPPRAAAPAPPVRSDPLLALRYRAGVIPPDLAARIAGVFQPLFLRPVWVALLAVFLAVDAWIAAHGVLDRFVAGVQQLALRPVLILVVLALAIASAAFHECGHAGACTYGGARVGELGVGLYVIWPAFYCKVTDSYRLNRVGRVRTDLGGIYFNTVFMAALGLTFLATGDAWLLPAMLALHVQTLWQFLPSLRLDGYYILADLVGVPDMFGYVRPALLTLLPGRAADPVLSQLNPRARRWIRLWVLLVVPSLLVWALVFVLAAPRVLPAAWDAAQQYLLAVRSAARRGDVVDSVLGVLQVGLLALPWVGLGLLLASSLRLLARRLGRRWEPGLQVRTATAARRAASAAIVPVVSALVVVRVAAVASSLRPTAGEARLVDSALAAVRNSTGPGVGPDEWLARLQLIAYTRATAAFVRHSSVVAGARELAVAATAALVVAFLVFALRRGASPLAMALPLLVVLGAGPAVTVLATVGAGLIGSAEAAIGLLVVILARNRVVAFGGLVLLALGVATAPLLAVPLVAAIGVHLAWHRSQRGAHHAGGRHAAPAEHTSRWWLAVLLLLPPAGVAPVVLAAEPGEGALSGAQRVVLLLLAAAVTAAGLQTDRVRPWMAAAAATTALAALPWPGAGAALPAALVAAGLLGCLLVDQRRGVLGQDRSHPLLRVATAIPVLVLAVTNLLFIPASSPQLPHERLATWINSGSSEEGTVAVPAALWGDLVHDGVPPRRLARIGTPAAAEASWTVTIGPGGAISQPVATIDRGGQVLTVEMATRLRERLEARAEAERLQQEAQRRADESERTARGAYGAILTGSPRLGGPQDVLDLLPQGDVDPRVMALLADLVRRHDVTVVDFSAAAGAPETTVPRTAVVISRLDGRPATAPDVAAAVAEEVRGTPTAGAPGNVVAVPDGLAVSWG